MRGYYDSNPQDRYVHQALRQARGLVCSECGCHQGHFGFCPLFHNGLPMAAPVSPYVQSSWSDLHEEVTMEQVLGKDKPQPDSQSFYRKAQGSGRQVLPEDYSPVYSEADLIMAHALGVKLREATPYCGECGGNATSGHDAICSKLN